MPASSRTNDDAEAKARILIEDVAASLAAGTEHYDVDGRQLFTVRDVIEALNRDWRVVLRTKP
jgi:hypothetical protein